MISYRNCKSGPKQAQAIVNKVSGFMIKVRKNKKVVFNTGRGKYDTE